MSYEELVKRLANHLDDLPQHLGEDSDFQAIDEFTDDLWRLLFDALNLPQGKFRTDIVHHYHNIPHSNLDEAYKSGSEYYDNYFNTPEEVGG